MPACFFPKALGATPATSSTGDQVLKQKRNAATTDPHSRSLHFCSNSTILTDCMHATPREAYNPPRQNKQTQLQTSPLLSSPVPRRHPQSCNAISTHIMGQAGPSNIKAIYKCRHACSFTHARTSKLCPGQTIECQCKRAVPGRIRQTSTNLGGETSTYLILRRSGKGTHPVT